MPSIDNIHQDKPSDQVQAVFTGLNASDPPHLLAQDEVASATNIDFTLEAGAAAVRRGSTQIVSISTTANPLAGFLEVAFLNISEGAQVGSDGAIYANQGAVLYRSLGGTTTAIATASVPSAGWVMHPYGSYNYAAGGADVTVPSSFIKDDGTVTTDWIVQAPASSPTVTINTMSGQNLLTTLTASEGTLLASNSFSNDASTFRLDVEQAIASHALSTISGNAVGDYGVISVQFAFSNPKNVNRISMDFGIGSAFNNYYHYELDITANEGGYPDPTVLMQRTLIVPARISGTTTITGQPVTPSQLQAMQAALTSSGKPGATSIISAAKQTLNTWLLPKTNFQTVFRDPNPGDWDRVGTARMVIEGTGTFTATISNWQIQGASNFSLNDVNIGYSWWETWAQIDPNTGVIYGESAPSPRSPLADGSHNPLKMQYANVTISDTSFPTGTSHGVTHRIFYRQGGFLSTPYAVGTIPLVQTTFTDTMPDIQALMLNNPMNTDVRTIAEMGRTPRGIADYYDRLFLLASNTLMWSLPGQFAEFPRDSYAVMGDGGDIGMALIAWLPRLVIINDHSVYEMIGQDFETPGGYTLFKTGCRHGSKSLLVPIKTPYGIPLIDYDGIFMYTPGQGVEQSLDWVMQKVGDMWRGQGATDPAGYKGNRVPAIDLSNLVYACAAYADSKLYIGLPCETGQTRCNTVLVIDFRYQKCFIHQYPFFFYDMFWDQFKNRLYVLTTAGNVKQIETGVTDSPEPGAGGSNIVWSFKTRSWPAPTDILMENFAVQYRGGSSTVTGIYDQTNTSVIGTLTASNKVWTIPTLAGSIANDVAFVFNGTQATGTQNAIYQVDWDLWMQPKKVVFYRTDYDDNGTTGEKIYDVHFTDMQIIPTGTASATVLATAFVDDVAVATFTLTGYNEKKRYEFSYPAETYGNIAFTIYQAGPGTQFKLYGHHIGARNEPPRVTVFDTDRVTGGEQWWREVLTDINPLGGTVTAVFMLDEVAQATFTITNPLSGTSTTSSTGRAVYPNTIQTQEPYGKVAYMKYSSTLPFKHYKTWYMTEAQPDRLTFSESSHDTLPSVGVIKTWLFEANPQGGTITGTLYLDGVNIQTATFTGSVRHIYEVGTPNLTVGKTLKAVYTSTTPFKNWRTHFEIDPKPFYKTTWNIIYRRVGGATQLDLARFWELDIESTNTATITSTWFADGTAVLTNTFTNVGRNYTDRISFPPGIFAYLLQQEMTSDQPFHMWSSRVEIERIGVKGFSVVGINGTPQEQQTVTPAEGQVSVKPYSTQYQF